MPDRQKHRGPHPEDRDIFAESCRKSLGEAVRDLTFLLSRGYAGPSSLKLVGDRYRLRARQRAAVARIACSDAEFEVRGSRAVAPVDVRGRALWIDGFNVLTSVEAALSGGIILAARDGCYRDLASMHGNYRVLEETRPAAEMVMEVIDRLSPSEVCWYLDKPVSNSGRLKVVLEEIAASHSIPATVQIVPDPDVVLAALEGDAVVVATADSGILDRCGAWFSLARLVIEKHVPKAEVLDVISRYGEVGAGS